MKLRLAIEEQTDKEISLIAIERIFGFKKAKFAPSLYTLDLLAKYCNFESWSSFCEQQDRDEILTQG